MNGWCRLKVAGGQCVAALRRERAAQRPQDLGIMHRLLGPLCRPIATQGRSHRRYSRLVADVPIDQGITHCTRQAAADKWLVQAQGCTRSMWERPCVAKGPRSGPRISACPHRGCSGLVADVSIDQGITHCTRQAAVDKWLVQAQGCTRSMWERPCVAKGPGSGPRISASCIDCWGRFAALSRHKAAPTGVTQASWQMCPSTKV